MPFVTNNILLQNLSGKLGNIVLRQLNGKTVMQAAPVRKAPATPGELKNRETFKQAVAYAKQAHQNHERWQMYLAEAKRRGGTSNWFAVAVSDFRNGFRLVKAQLAGRLKVRKQVLKKEFALFLLSDCTPKSNSNIQATRNLRYLTHHQKHDRQPDQPAVPGK